VEDILRTFDRHRNENYLKNNNIKDIFFSKKEVNIVRGMHFFY